MTANAHPPELKRVHRWIAEHAAATPDRVAFVCDDSPITYSELNNAVAAAAGAFLEFGIEIGETICIDSQIPEDLVIGNIAAIAIGAIAVPLPPKNRDECDYILKDSATRLLLTRDPSRFTELGNVTSLEPPCGVTAGISPIPEREIGPMDTVLVLYTSGTTSGKRKGVMLPYLALRDSIDNRINLMGITDEIVEYLASPIHVVFGFGRCRLVFQCGGTIIYNSGTLNPAKLLTALERYGCNSIGGDSSIYILLLKYYAKQLARVGENIRWIEAASQAMAVDQKKQLMDIMPNAGIYMNYGLTEAIFSTVIKFERNSDKLGSAGTCAANVDVSIVNPEGASMAPGDVGEICVSGTSLAAGYWNQMELWNAVSEGGWYHTGDLGYLDADAYLYVVGRKNDLVNVGGRTISPDEAEHVLLNFLPNVEYAICGIDDDGPLGEVLALCVEGDTEVDLGALRNSIGESVSEYLIPKRVFNVSALPRTENGKVIRRALQDRIAST